MYRVKQFLKNIYKKIEHEKTIETMPGNHERVKELFPAGHFYSPIPDQME
jgi:hypothetical protein